MVVPMPTTMAATRSNPKVRSRNLATLESPRRGERRGAWGEGERLTIDTIIPCAPLIEAPDAARGGLDLLKMPTNEPVRRPCCG